MVYCNVSGKSHEAIAKQCYLIAMGSCTPETVLGTMYGSSSDP
jgi:hypothetical protein